MVAWASWIDLACVGSDESSDQVTMCVSMAGYQKRKAVITEERDYKSNLA
jgi:hypothetical protein